MPEYIYCKCGKRCDEDNPPFNNGEEYLCFDCYSQEIEVIDDEDNPLE